MRKPLLITIMALVSGLFVTGQEQSKDRQKTEHEIRRITALAADPTARPVVNRAFSDALKTDRNELVSQRRDANLSYGGLFLAHYLMLADPQLTLGSIASQLTSGRDLFQLGDAQHADWKRIAAESEKMNGKLEAAFYQYFQDRASGNDLEAHQHYDARRDSVPADTQGVTRQELAAAQDTYERCLRRAGGAQSGNADALPNGRDRDPGLDQDPR
jgi:hypothetical protein